MELNNTSKLILAFVTLILGAVLIGTIATNTQAVSTLTTFTDTFSLSSVRLAGGAILNTTGFALTKTGSGWREDVSECSASGVVTSNNLIVKNSTGAILDNNGCDTGEYYVVNGLNAIYFCNNPAVNNSVSNRTTVTYQACADDYLAQGWSRTVINLIVGFFALALMGISVGLFYSIAKDNDWF